MQKKITAAEMDAWIASGHKVAERAKAAILRTQRNGHVCAPIYFTSNEACAEQFIKLRRVPEVIRLEIMSFPSREIIAIWNSPKP